MARPITISRTFAAPPAKAFAALSDFPNAHRIVPAIVRVEMLTPGPVGIGTRFRETRSLHGSQATEEMEVTRFDPPRGLTLEATSHGTHYRTSYTLSPRGQGTHVTMVFAAKPKTFMAGLLAALLNRAVMKALKAILEKDLEHAAAYAEGL